MTVLPELGGKVLSLVHKPTDVELLWSNPRLKPIAVAFGSSYDDQFFGGWDELYPNDLAEELVGEQMPDHGEVWSVPWEWSVGTEANRAWVELRVQTPISSSSVVKTISLSTDASHLDVSYKLENTGTLAQPFMWKSHVAALLHDDSRLDMGAGSVLLHEFGSPRARGNAPLFDWPILTSGEVRHDMRILPAPNSGVSEFMLATSMRQGFCSVAHPSKGVGLRLDFDLAALPSCWTFASYGGWRGLHVLVLEPCSGYPLSVSEGVASGTHAVLAPGEVRRWSLTASATHLE